MPDFKKIAENAGLKTEETHWRNTFTQQSRAAGFEVSNTSEFSPWWRLLQSLIAKPVIQIIDALTNKIMPQFFIKTATGEALDALAAERGIARLPAIKTRGIITLMREQSEGNLTVPAGTLIESDSINGHVYTLVTVDDAVFNDTAATATVSVIATNAGAANNLGAGYYNRVLNAEEITATNEQNWIVEAGANSESDEHLRERAIAAFATLGRFHTDDIYRTIITQNSSIKNHNMLFVHNAPRGAGSADCYVWADVGAVPAAEIASLNNIISGGLKGNGDDLQVKLLPTSPIDLTVELTAESADAENIIRAVFRENAGFNVERITPAQTYYLSQITTEIHNRTAVKVKSWNIESINTGTSMPVLKSLTVVVND
jgi:uncharacterized phage protein gp47/JayE